jgi:hypothetical protein
MLETNLTKIERMAQVREDENMQYLQCPSPRMSFLSQHAQKEFHIPLYGNDRKL